VRVLDRKEHGPRTMAEPRIGRVLRPSGAMFRLGAGPLTTQLSRRFPRCYSVTAEPKRGSPAEGRARVRSRADAEGARRHRRRNSQANGSRPDGPPDDEAHGAPAVRQGGESTLSFLRPGAGSRPGPAGVSAAHTAGTFGRTCGSA
jgi:hypothetical protein